MEEGITYVFDNIINGKRYCGSHNDKKPNYFGSGGDHWQKAQAKWGRENLPMRVIYRGPHFREAETLVIVALDLCGHPMWYNKSHIHNTAIHSDESRSKMGHWGGKTLSEDHKANITAALTGRVFTDEHKKNMKSAKLNQTVETRAKISKALVGNTNSVGRVHSEETKAKMRAAAKARPPISEETRAKLSAAKRKVR